MMAIRKRGDSWQIDYIDPTGKRVRKSFKKKRDAVAEHGKRVSLIAENRYLDVKKDFKTTFAELLEKYVENFKHQTSFKNAKWYFIDNFKERFGEDTLLCNIRYVDLETYRNHLITKLTKNGKIRTSASINREMDCLHQIFSKGTEWEMMEQNPFERGRSLRLKEDNARIRYLTEDEIDRLLDECKHKKHLHWIVKCALNTGLRKGDILNLKWEQLRNGFIYPDKNTDTKKRREIPINDEMAEVFKEIRKEQELKYKYVFIYAKKNISHVATGFNAALKRVGIEDFRFHDLRHTFASHLIMRGANLKEVQELLGHNNIKMTMRYAHLSQEHKKKAVNLLNGLTSSVKSDMSQNVTKPKSNPITT